MPDRRWGDASPILPLDPPLCISLPHFFWTQLEEEDMSKRDLSSMTPTLAKGGEIGGQ